MGDPFPNPTGTLSDLLKKAAVEERGLAVSRASDFGIVRSAGGALSFITTKRPSVFIDEPGHWLGDIQRTQCINAGLCTGISIDAFRKNPRLIIKNLACQIEKTGNLLVNTSLEAESDLAHYIFETYQ